MKKNKYIGRPTEMTSETLVKLENMFSLGASDLEACLMADISQSTLYNFQKKHPEFLERKQMLKEKLVLKARTVIADALNRGDEKTAQWYLEKKRKDEFSSKIETSGDLTIQKVYITPEQQKAVETHIDEVLKDDGK